MKYETPMYEGDSIIRRMPEPQPEVPKGQIEVDSTPKMLQRKITPLKAEPVLVDTFEIERRARALRAAAMRFALVSFRSRVERFLATARRRRDEEYLARAESLAELEARLRRLERGRHLLRV